MKIATILSAHENSEVYRDTLDSIRKYMSNDIMVLIDGFAWNQFKEEKVDKIEGFRHGKASAPVRNMALGLMEAWARWGESVNWYCYIEYDCLVGSSEVFNHLSMADERGFWLLGNQLRKMDGHIPELDRLCGLQKIRLYSLLGCCLFFSTRFMRELNKNKMFNTILENANFFTTEFNFSKNIAARGPKNVYDSSEFIYPSLAVHYGGTMEEMAHWDEKVRKWNGNYLFYPMRFMPELSSEDPFHRACIMHPLKHAKNPIRAYHRAIREFHLNSAHC